MGEWTDHAWHASASPMHPAPNGAVSSTSIASIEAALSEPPSMSIASCGVGTRAAPPQPPHTLARAWSPAGEATRSSVGSSCGRAKSSRRPKRRLPNAAPDVAATVLQTAALPGPRRPAEAAPRPGQAPAGVAPCRRSTQQQRRSRASEHSPASASRRRCPSPRRRIQPPPLPTRAPDPRRSRHPPGLRLRAETIASFANPRLASCHAVAALQQQPTSKPRMAAHAGRSELRRGHACRVAAVEKASPGIQSRRRAARASLGSSSSRAKSSRCKSTAAYSSAPVPRRRMQPPPPSRAPAPRRSRRQPGQSQAGVLSRRRHPPTAPDVEAARGGTRRPVRAAARASLAPL